MTADLRVVATAGHVDHGKSSLIARLTGIDPDRFAEEKRRGLTIDLGYAWCELPSGLEIGFVDVPGHERFIANMLAGVGPVRLALFVVAADEGWKPQSEEHLQILDVLGVAGGVVALTKRDLVRQERLASAEGEVRERLQGTGLREAPIVPVSPVTGEGIEDLLTALDEMLRSAPAPEPARTRLFVDRVFSIKGAGTVATGTLTGNSLRVGDDVELYPDAGRARVRSLQTHKRSVEAANPVSRVAANLVGLKREQIERGDVLGVPAEWQPTTTFEAELLPVRGLARRISARGAFKVHTGAGEADARLRIYSDDPTYARITVSRPLTLDVFDRFVLRDAGRRETVAGGVVLDVDPPSRAGVNPSERLAARTRVTRAGLPALLVSEKGAITERDLRLATGSSGPGLPTAGDWHVAPEVAAAAESAVVGLLEGFHGSSPLSQGADGADIRNALEKTLRGITRREGLADALIENMVERGVLAQEASTLRLATHRIVLDAGSDEFAGLLQALGGELQATPPTIKDLATMGIDRDVIEAAARAGAIVKVGADLVFMPVFLTRAEQTVRDAGPDGITVSAFREALGTTRKYAVPLLEWFDQRRITERVGDVRIART